MLRTRFSRHNEQRSYTNQSKSSQQSNPNAIANGITVMMEMFAGLAFILLIALSMAMFGCGQNEARTTIQPVSVNTETVTPIDSAPDTTAPINVPVEIADEPRVVTFDEAEKSFNARNYDEAMQLFTAYTEQSASNAWGHYMLGLSAKRAGDAGTSETAFRRALELDPKHVKSLLNLSRVLIDDDRPQAALDELDRALDLDAESSVAYRLRGRAFHNLGWLDDAVNAYRDAIIIDSTDAWSMNNLALVQLEQQQYEKALTALSRTIELRDDVAIFFNNLGMALEHTGYVRDAEAAYTSAVELDASYDKASTNRDRVAGIAEDPALPPVDLRVLAQTFIEEIRSWNEEALAAENANMIELDQAVEAITSSETSHANDFYE